MEAARNQPPGLPVRTRRDIKIWLETDPTEQLPDGSWVATFIVSLNEVLFLAPRRSEHIACAAGEPVLSAGEITLDAEIDVIEISNQSTGFCPEPESWSAVRSVLDNLGIGHPGDFTNSVTFRRCPKCGERNIVKDAWYFCLLCASELPEQWNFDSI